MICRTWATRSDDRLSRVCEFWASSSEQLWFSPTKRAKLSFPGPYFVDHSYNSLYFIIYHDLWIWLVWVELEVVQSWNGIWLTKWQYLSSALGEWLGGSLLFFLFICNVGIWRTMLKLVMTLSHIRKYLLSLCLIADSKRSLIIFASIILLQMESFSITKIQSSFLGAKVC